MEFGAFGVWNGTGHLFSGNHWFPGYVETNGIRRAGLIFTTANPKATVVGNYVDNNFIEITSEHDASPDLGNEFAFGGIPITGNVFRSLNGNIDRVDHVDETYASLGKNLARNVIVQGNTFNLVNQPIYNPLTFKHVESSDSASWIVRTDSHLPFGGMTKSMVGLVPDGKILRSTNTHVTEFPYTALKQGANLDELRVKWSQACRGTMHLTVRMDNAT